MSDIPSPAQLAAWEARVVRETTLTLLVVERLRRRLDRTWLQRALEVEGVGL